LSEIFKRGGKLWKHEEEEAVFAAVYKGDMEIVRDDYITRRDV